MDIPSIFCIFVFKENVMARVSYSRYSMWTTCPQQYKFNYVDKLGVYSGSIHTIFGTAFHETLQHYLDIFYNKTKKQANEINLPQLLKERLVDTFKKEHEGFEEGKFVCSKEELMEFYEDGVVCLDWFKKHSDDFFTKKGWELVGIELPLNVELKPNVSMLGYLDIVIRHKEYNLLKIIDFKTSTRGWSKEQKADKTKLNQLLLYKHYYSEQYNHPIDRIQVEFQIIKRKISENTEYTIPRISKLVPANGGPSVARAVKDFIKFVDEVFNEDGTDNLNADYSPNPGEKNKNCRFCEFKDRCPAFQK